jgi:hypothetical protein
MRGQRHLQYQLTFKVKGKTRTVYVPRELLKEVKTWVQEHKRLKRLMKEISQLAVALVKTHVRHSKLKGGPH